MRALAGMQPTKKQDRHGPLLKGLKIERKCDQASACLGKLGKEVGSDSDARCDTRTDKWDQGHIRLFG
jgi:hypothetical protein